jgi:hypothetical protein
MADVNNAAEASAAAPKFTQFDSWDEEGNPVVSKKPEAPEPKSEEAAASPEPGKKGASEAGKPAKSAAETESAEGQDGKRKPGEKLSAGEELGKLRRELRDAKKELESLRERSRTPEPKPGDARPEARADAKPGAKPDASAPVGRPKPKLDDKGPDGKSKYPAYEDWVEDVSDWKAEQRVAAVEAERARNESARQFTDAVKAAREAYADFDTVAEPMAAEVNKLLQDPKIDPTLKKALIDKDACHILYALGKDAEISEKFGELARTDPAEAIFVWKSLKQSVKKELAKPAAAAAADADGKTPAPASTKPRAPKPPSEVGGRGASGEDALVSAAKANDFRTFDAEQTRRALASRR